MTYQTKWLWGLGAKLKHNALLGDFFSFICGKFCFLVWNWVRDAISCYRVWGQVKGQLTVYILCPGLHLLAKAGCFFWPSDIITRYIIKSDLQFLLISYLGRTSSKFFKNTTKFYGKKDGLWRPRLTRKSCGCHHRGDTSYNAIWGGSARKGYLFQATGTWITSWSVYKRLGKCLISVCKKAQKD